MYKNKCGPVSVVGADAYACCIFYDGIALGLGACATIHNLPLNQPSATPFAGFAGAAAARVAAEQKLHGENDGTVVGLSFSGGGTRAAAFAYGVLDQLARTPGPHGRSALLDRVGVVSGVSGGSIIAAYYGLKGRAALADFRERFLVQDVMAVLDTNVNLINIGQALGGGANTDNRLRNWFNANLYHDATFRDLIGRRPIVLINATDIYSRTPFLFAPQSFAAACSDITQYPIAAAVAASAAVPAAFAPIIIETFPGQCQTPLPPWVHEAAANTAASPLLHAYAKGLEDIRDGKVKYVKLFDGGLIDNYGLSGLTIIRARDGHALRPVAAGGSRQPAALFVPGGGRGTKSEGRLVANAGRPGRQATGRRGGRRFGRRQCACELRGLRSHHAQLARRHGQMALRPEARRRWRVCAPAGAGTGIAAI